MSLVRLMSDVATTPAVAFKNPLTCPKVKPVDAMMFVDEAVVAVIIVVEANGIDEAIPSPLIVVVAERPTYRTSSAERREVEALPVNCIKVVVALMPADG